MIPERVHPARFVQPNLRELEQFQQAMQAAGIGDDDVAVIDCKGDYQQVMICYLTVCKLEQPKVIALHGIVGLYGYRGTAKAWSVIGYAPRLDYGEDVELRPNCFEAIDGNDRCIGIGWRVL